MLVLSLALASLLLSVRESKAEVKRRVHQATRIPEGQRITIDGRIEEKAWESAKEVTGFVWIDPASGAPADERTHVRMLYDDDALYFAARLERVPGESLGMPILTRDDFTFTEAFVVKLDVTRDRRTSYLFQVSADNHQLDLVSINRGQEVIVGWDALWETATWTKNKDAWTAEMRIPFSSLGIDPGIDYLGVQYQRVHGDRRRIYAWWTFVDSGYSHGWNPHYGKIVGVEGIKTGQPFSLTPFLRISSDFQDVSVREAYREGLDVRLKAGLSIDTRLVSGVWAGATLLPDFGDVDLDDPVQNLNRFSILLPEKRPFFLTGLSILQFGNNSNARLFASRAIGFNNGYLPLFGGLKIYGREGPIAIGLLDVVSENPRTNWGVGRIKYEGERATFGVMSTLKTGLGEGVNDQVAATGVDSRLNLLDGRLIMDGAFSASNGKVAGELLNRGLSSQGSAEWRGVQFRPSLSHLWVQPDYVAPAGFVQRTNILQTSVNLPYFMYGKLGWRQVVLSSSASYLRDAKADEELGYSTGMSGSFTGESINVNLSAGYAEDVVRNEFSLSGKAPVAAGTYAGPNGFASFSLGDTDPQVSASVFHSRGFFGGTLSQVNTKLETGRIPWMRLSVSSNSSLINVPSTPRYWEHQVIGVVAVSNSPSWVLTATPRWDNTSKKITGLARLAWQVAYNAQVAVVYQNTLLGGVRQQLAIAKLRYRFDTLL